MNIIDTLLSRTDQFGVMPVQGRWFNVRYKPNLNTGEILNVGIGFVTDEGQYHCRMLENFKGFTCIYGEEMERHVRFLVHVIETSIKAGHYVSPSENIEYSDYKYAGGHTAEEVINELFDTTVTLAGVHADDEKEQRQVIAFDDGFVRKQVFTSIRRRAQLEADQIIAENPNFILEEGNLKHVLDIPLQGRNRLGSVVSALYSSRNSVEVHLLRATVDLETARRTRVNDEVGLFALRPSFSEHHIPETTLRQIDNLIDEVDWKLRRQKIRFDVQDNAENLASEIMSWAGIKAA